MSDVIDRFTAAIEGATIPDQGGATLVQLVLTWEEHGEPHMCHQAYLIEHRDGRITRDTVWCGGRWDPALMAQMAEANAVHA